MKKSAFIFIATVVCMAFAQSASFHFYPGYANYLNRRHRQMLKDRFYFKADTEEKIVAITIDDGPSSNTERLTDLLKRKECPAAFFLVGKHMTRNLVEFYNDTLFEIGSHGFDHYDFDTLTTRSVIRADFARSLERHAALMPFAEEVRYYRPPFGVINRRVAEMLDTFNLQGVLWSFDTMDWSNPSRQQILRNIDTRLTSGDIILLHESINLNTLESVIDRIRENGFTIVKLGDLMRHPNIVPQ